MKATLQVWLGASRPKTLPLACLAIVSGSLLALSQGSFSWGVLGLSLLTASLLQVLSNLANDYGDGLRGVDDAQRLGPVRALQSGALTAAQLQRSLWLVAALCLASGLGLLLAAQLSPAGWLAFIVLGLLAIAAALAYTLGKRPYGYAGLGDLAVWLFFGLLGVLGSSLLHGAPWSFLLLLPASASGLLAAAVLNINNMRDIETDARHSKRTLAVRLGLVSARRYHHLLLATAWLQFFCYLLLADSGHWPALIFIAALWPLLTMARHVAAAVTPSAMAPLLPAMVKVACQVTLLFAVALLLHFLSRS